MIANLFCLLISINLIQSSQSSLSSTDTTRVCISQFKTEMSATTSLVDTTNNYDTTNYLSSYYLDTTTGDSVELFVRYSSGSIYFSSLKTDLTFTSEISVTTTASSIRKLINQILIVDEGSSLTTYRYYKNSGSYSTQKVILSPPNTQTGLDSYRVLSYEPFAKILNIALQDGTSTKYGIYNYDLTSASGSPLSCTPSVMTSLSISPVNVYGNGYMFYDSNLKKLYKSDGIQKSGVSLSSTTFYQYKLMKNIAVLLFGSPDNKMYYLTGSGTGSQAINELSITSGFKYWSDSLRNFIVADSANLRWITVLIDGTVRYTQLTTPSDYSDFTSAKLLQLTLSGNRAFIARTSELVIYEHYGSGQIQKVSSLALSDDPLMTISSGAKKLTIVPSCICDRFSCFSTTLGCFFQKFTCSSTTSPFVL